jgi:membrane-associated phospholipid phosphatase
MHTLNSRGRVYGIVALVLLTLAAGLSLYAWQTDQASWEVRLVNTLQESGPPGLHEVSMGLAIAGHGIPWMMVLSCIGAWLWLMGSVRLVVILGVVAALQEAGAVLKLIIERARPPAGTVDVWREISSYSFPSGHTLGATLIFGFLFFALDHCDISDRARAALRVFSVTWIALMGLGRVQLGAHWPTDVLGAYLIGALLLLPIVFYLRRAHA